ncbi:transcription factor bHLH121 [Dendrobium catenatum]|uniref:Transcription factor bHLH121 n=1 Tax=Dendrobium catenatum TaxID=906689 RepID=A0A2I0VIK6_9ASPA|nr:transcription factor bHLH121 [Dendrobium catenatum]PKU63213.1 Transcription factor bHLH121 [Dendrobium catenatum]
MDQWKPAEGFFQGMAVTGISGNDFGREGDPGVWSGGLPVPCPDSSQRVDKEAKDSSNVRKVHKADREKLRRDRLNEQFLELGNAIDPDRPKNDKATILGDAVLMLKDLTAQVQKLKAEHTSLSEESRELTQEKNELREEKSVLKSEIENLNAQHQQRLGCLYPWATVDPSVVMGPPSAYPFPIPVPVASGPMPFHAPIPLYPFFQNQRPAAIPSHCSSYHPYTSSRSPYVEQQPSQHLPPHPIPSNDNNHNTSRHESQSGSSDWLRCSGSDRSTDFSDVVTELELKMPGSAKPCNSKPANLLTEGRKGCRSRQLQGKASENLDGSSSSRCSSPPGLPASSSNSNGGGSVANSL